MALQRMRAQYLDYLQGLLLAALHPPWCYRVDEILEKHFVEFSSANIFMWRVEKKSDMGKGMHVKLKRHWELPTITGTAGLSPYIKKMDSAAFPRELPGDWAPQCVISQRGRSRCIRCRRL